MNLYRIGPEHRLEDYRGLGASYMDGARWNLPSSPVLYFSLSPAVAMLEMANYFSTPRHIPKHYRLGVYRIHSSVKTMAVDSKKLPTDWREYPHPRSTQEMGDKWLSSLGGVLFLVPSAAVPGTEPQVAVFNPLHKSASKIRLIRTEDEIFSQRCFADLK